MKTTFSISKMAYATSMAMIFLLLCGCSEKSSEDAGHLIFHSGFEKGSTVVDQTSDGLDIIGTDESVDPPNDWVRDLEEKSKIGLFRIEYQGGDSTMRWADIIEDPTNPGNHVLHYWMHKPNVGTEKAYGGKFRTQVDLYRNTDLYEVYYKVRLYLTEDWDLIRQWEEKMRWFILAEYWNNPAWTGEDFPFRIHLTINKDEGADNPLYFGLGAQTKDDGWKELWHENGKNYPIPVKEWMTLMVYFKEGDGENGRYYLAVETEKHGKEMIFDVTGYTHHPGDSTLDGLTHFNPLKGYSHRGNINYVREAGGTLQFYWDDFELWEGKGPL